MIGKLIRFMLEEIQNVTSITRRDDAQYWMLLIFTWFILCLPVLLVTYAPLVDYPNHLARAYIFYNYSDSVEFQSAYLRVIEPIPNLAIDLIISALLPFVSIEIASKMFLILLIT